MKLTKITLLAIVLAFAASSARSQTYKTDFSTQLKLAGGGVNPLDTLTIRAAAGTVPYTLTMPASVAGGAGYVLTSDESGNLSWTNPALGVTLAGDIVGSAGANHIADSAGNDIVAALNNARTTSALNVPVDITATGLSAGSGTVSGGAGTFTGAVSAAGLTSTAGLTTSGGTANINATGNNAVNIGISNSGNTGLITIGDSSAGNVSVTDINGQVNFGGPVSFPAGAVTSSSLGLADGKLLIGGSDGSAHPQTITQDVAITDAGVATVSSAHGDFAVGGNETVTGTLGAGATTVSSLTSNGAVSGTTATFSGNTSLDAAPSTGGSVTIGNSTPTLGDTSTTTVNGVLNITGPTTFTGPVTLPPGAVSSSSLKLANNDILIGNGTGSADSVHLTQDVTITNSGSNAATATVNGSHATTFAVANNATVGGTLGVTGQTTLGSTSLSAVTLAAPSGSVLALGSASSYYILTDNGSPETYSSITGANAATGQVIVIENASTTGADYITLTSGPGLSINGGNAILADGGTIQLIYDGTTWRSIGQ